MPSDLRHLITLLLILFGPLGIAPAGAQPPQSGEFSGDRAFVWLEEQVALGSREPGSAGNRQLREMILETARNLGFTATTGCLEVTDPLGGEPVEICNIVVTIAGTGAATAGRLWLGAHFDTRPIADHDPDPARRADPVPGANDGASGTAVLLHLMEVLQNVAPPTEVNLIFFDGEDSGAAGDPGGFCLGSKHLAASWQDFGSPLLGPPPRGLILLDMVGETGIAIPMEGYSRQYAPAWTEAVFARAAALGLTALVPEPGRPVYDDHVPFLAAGIPAVDLIDFEYAEWHTTADLPRACSAESLEQVGTLILDLVRHP